MSNRTPKQFEVGFIDQDDLVEFISDPTKIDESEKALTASDERGEMPATPTPTAGTDTEEDDFIPVLIEKKVKTSIDEESVLTKREDTRGRLALIYVIATFIIFFFGIVVAVLDGLNRDVSIIDNLKEIVPLFSGVFLGTLGFVLGYYFKNDEDS